MHREVNSAVRLGRENRHICPFDMGLLGAGRHRHLSAAIGMPTTALFTAGAGAQDSGPP